MIIHVVQPGDTIESIANKYEISTEKLIQINDLINPYSLVIGQTIVIAYPDKVYTVQEGDSLMSIANSHSVSIMQLLRNNPDLSSREFIYPGETIIISYPTIGKLQTNGYAFTYINSEILRKTLPFLTYLTIFNYTTTKEGEIISYEDDTEIIRIAKEYQVIPLMMVTTLAIQGDPNIITAYNILLNEEYQERNINNILYIVKSKGYYGINLVLYYMNISNQSLYEKFITKVSNRLRSEGFLLFVTINPNITVEDTIINFERINYSVYNTLVDNITFMNFIWGTNYGPPMPISSVQHMRILLDYVVPMVSTNILNIATPVIGYDWRLPYESGDSSAASITLNSAISLAHDANVPIYFDEPSQTPYYEYQMLNFGNPEQHIVRFEDARTINSILELVNEYKLIGSGIWNVMVYFAQLWFIIISQYDIEKLLSDTTQKGTE